MCVRGLSCPGKCGLCSSQALLAGRREAGQGLSLGVAYKGTLCPPCLRHGHPDPARHRDTSSRMVEP